MTRSRPSFVAAPGAINVAKLAQFGKGLRTASLRRAGYLKHHKILLKLNILINIIQQLVLFVVLFVKIVARDSVTSAEKQQK